MKLDIINIKNFKSFIPIGIFGAYLLAFIIIYKCLESPSVYDKYFAKIMPNYENINGNREQVTKPFISISSKALEETNDAASYFQIKNDYYNYRADDEFAKYNFGFFPLFPIVWKITHLSGKGILVFNYFLFAISILILASVFCPKSMVTASLVVLALPTLTVYFVPYSESVFLFCISIAILGWKRKWTSIFLLGLFLASCTRPVFLLLIGSFIATEIFFFIRNKNRHFEAKKILLPVAAILTGTLCVALFQKTFHHSSLLTFIEAQKHWGTFLQIPKTIVDWSNEGYAMNIWAMFFAFIFGFSILIKELIRKSATKEVSFNWWYYFSWIYIIAASVFVIILQGGCFHSLYRYTLCTPFFYIIVFQHLNENKKLNLLQPYMVTALSIFSSIYFIANGGYGNNWNFTKVGFVLLSLNLIFFIVLPRLNLISKSIGFGLLILGGIIWNCYLLNMFVSQAWIFL